MVLYENHCHFMLQMIVNVINVKMVYMFCQHLSCEKC